jgi:chromosome segregation ATPase
VAEQSPSERIKKGVSAFIEIAERVTGLEAELRDHERMLAEQEGQVESLQRELEKFQDAAPLIEDLEDLRRGVLTAEELFEKWLDYGWQERRAA